MTGTAAYQPILRVVCSKSQIEELDQSLNDRYVAAARMTDKADNTIDDRKTGKSSL